MAKKAHFIGICGVGMAGTALLLKESGWEISGSDEGNYPPVNTYLEARGISFSHRYSRDNIPRDAAVIVIGRHAKLSPETNEEVQAALLRGVPIKSFPDILEEILANRYPFVVAGNHGKSTLTALLAWCLLSAGKNPGYFIGALPIGFKKIASLGTDPLFIVEGDEYPTSHWDSGSKFFHYHPRDVLLTGAEHDHTNVFRTLEEYLAPFKKLVEELPYTGLLVACLDGGNMEPLIASSRARVVTYALDRKADYSAVDFHFGETSTFTLTRRGDTLIRLTTTLLGKHNIQNIVGASAYLLEKQLITPVELERGIATFGGLARRLDLKKSRSSVLVYEGFGSSYSKARSAIEAVRLHFPEKRLIVVFEPHTFSWRDRETLYWYDDVFKGSDKVIIYKSRALESGSKAEVGHEEIIDRVLRNGQSVIGATKPEKVLAILKHEISPQDLILLLSSGDLGGLTELIPRFVEAKYPLRV